MSGEPTGRPPSILEEIQQSKPFRSRSQEAYLALLRTADESRRRIGQVLESAGVTLQQYNVLRILRGAGKDGLPTLAVAERMIERTPGVTRLIDRMEKKKLVRRTVDRNDRRSVLLEAEPMDKSRQKNIVDITLATEKALFSSLSQREKSQLLKLLNKVFDSCGNELDAH